MLCVQAWCPAGMVRAQAGPGGQSPQLIPRSQEQRERDFAAEHHAILNVKVTAESGDPVMDLKPEDFTLLDNGQPRAIASVQVVEHPAPPGMPRMILLLDAVNQPLRHFNADVVDVRKYLLREHGELAVPIAIGVFADSGLTIGEASQNRLAVLQQLDTMTHAIKSMPCTDLKGSPISDGIGSAQWGSIRTLPHQTLNCLNSRFIRSVWNLETLAVKEENTLGRCILVWIGPGWPRLEGGQFMQDPPPLTENYFEHLVSISTALREGWVTLDTVATLGRNPSPDERKAVLLERGVAQEKEMTASSLSLHSLAYQSGGQVLDKTGDLPAAIEQCVKDAEFYYVLSFDFPAAAEANEYHSIEVKVNRPGVVVRTNTVYYAQP